MCPPLSDIPAILEMRGQASIDDLIGNHVETSWEIEKCGPFAMMRMFLFANVTVYLIRLVVRYDSKRLILVTSSYRISYQSYFFFFFFFRNLHYFLIAVRLAMNSKSIPIIIINLDV